MLILVKLIMLIVVLYLAYLLAFRVNGLLFQRLFCLTGGLIISILILFPDLSTRIANFFGIGRGADFIFYLSHLLVFYVLVRQYLQYLKMNQALTTLTREIALANARKP